jgi:hypothetical protein
LSGVAGLQFSTEEAGPIRQLWKLRMNS